MVDCNFKKKNLSFIQLGFSLSNWQKVQFNTELFFDTQEYLNKKEWLD